MKKFLLISISLLVVALIIVVAVFLYFSFYLTSPDKTDLAIPHDYESSTTPAAEHESTTTTNTAAVTDIPLRDLPMNETQRSVLDTVGVDVDTFVITPEMQVCAQEKLGQTRMAEIIAGAAPSVIETTKLLTCL